MKRRLLSLLAVFCMVLALMPGAASAAKDDDDVAYQVTGGNIYFDKATGIITDCDDSVTEANIPPEIEGVAVTSIGEGAFRGYFGQLKSVTIPDSVTSIGDYAFEGCDDLTSVTIPSSVTSIGVGAFRLCDKLTIIEVEGGNQKYSSKDGVLFNLAQTELIEYPEGKTGTYRIPDGVTSIGEEAFYSCNLTGVTIPASVTNIGKRAFMYCKGLTEVTIPGSVTSIGEEAFDSCQDLTSVTIPDSVTSIGDSAFNFCNNLVSVTLPSGIKSIPAHLFETCRSLKSITIPNSVTSIGSYAFQKCDSLTSVTIPNSVTSIGYAAFSWCDTLTSIDVETGNQQYSSKDGVLFNVDQTELIMCPGGKKGAYIVPDNVYAIGNGAFEWCDKLTSVSLPGGVTRIGSDAFWGCNAMTSITIPASVTSIESGAFPFSSDYSLTNLKDVYYSGTEAQWKELIENAGMDNDALLTVTVHYVNTDAEINRLEVTGAVTQPAAPQNTGTKEAPEALTALIPYQSGSVDVPVTVEFSPDAKAYYGADANSTSTEITQNKITVTGVSYPTGGTVCIKIVPESGEADATYYVLTIKMEAPETDADLMDVSAAIGKSVYSPTSIPTGSGDPAAPAEAVIKLPSGVIADSGVTMTVLVPGSASSVCTVAAADTPSGAAGYGEAQTPTVVVTGEDEDGNEIKAGKVELRAQAFDGGKAFYIRVVAQDGTTAKYYKITFNTTDIRMDSELAKPDVDETDVKGKVPAGKEENVVQAAKDTGIDDVSQDTVKDAAFAAAVKESGDAGWSDEAVKEKLKAELGEEPEEAYVRVVTYLNVEIMSFDDTSEKEIYIVDLTPMYYVAASTNESGEMKFDGEDADSCYLVEPTELKDMGPVQVKVKLPEGFSGTIYVTHKGIVQDVTVADNTVTFSVDSFSEFTFSQTDPSRAKIGDISYATVQDAIDAVQNGQTVTLTGQVATDEIGSLKTPVTGVDHFEFTITGDNLDKVHFIDTTEGGYTYKATVDAATGKVTVSRTFAGTGGGTIPSTPDTPSTPTTPTSPYDDVSTGAWYYDAVKYVTDKGLMNGVDTRIFAPDGNLTRGQLVTILYRLEGEPAAGTSFFTDVADGKYYAKAVAWAEANGIVKGETATTFHPEGDITREQIAAILYRYVEYKKYDTKAQADLSGYADAGKVSTYAETAMKWANAEGLITGRTATTLAPAGNATRAEIATILMRFCEDVIK